MSSFAITKISVKNFKSLADFDISNLPKKTGAIAKSTRFTMALASQSDNTDLSDWGVFYFPVGKNFENTKVPT